jgi:hypothetical protein
LLWLFKEGQTPIVKEFICVDNNTRVYGPKISISMVSPEGCAGHQGEAAPAELLDLDTLSFNLLVSD